MSLITLPERRSIWPTPPRWSIWGDRRGFDPVAALLKGSEFYAPLTHSLVLTRGTGSATFTRATKAWEFGYAAAANSGADQVLIEVATGTPRFGGARYDSGTWYNTYADGSAISASSLLGYHAEGARTNSLLYSRDLRYWREGSEFGADLATNGDFSIATGWTVSGAGLSITGGKLEASSAVNGAQATLGGFTIGKRYAITFTVDAITTGTVRGFWSSGAGTNRTTAGTYTDYFVATHTTGIGIQCAGTTTATVDNVIIKEAAIQVTTCTGIDNAANSASTLTAGASDATILQTLTLAAAARSFSAYVKRRTGTGNVYITRDGGTNWTDITSSLGASWTRVKIENTSVLNPQVGFKIATSGDAIDVDVCQDEAGAFVSSPIITTTAAVTRNIDSLTYANNLPQSAGSWVFSGYTTVPYNVGVDASFIGTAQGKQYLGSANVRTALTVTDGTKYPTQPWLTRLTTGGGKYGASWGGSTLRSAGEGSVTSGSFDGTFGNSTTLGIGDQATTGQPIFGHIKDVYVWQSALTDAQLQQVTA